MKTNPGKCHLWISNGYKKYLLLILVRVDFLGLPTDVRRVGLRRGWGWLKCPFPKICHRYPRMMELGTVTSYTKKIQKICKSRDTLFESC